MNLLSKLPVTLLLLFLVNSMAAQKRGRTWNVTGGIQLPVGHFYKTHFLGAGAGLSYSDHRYGILPVKPVKKFGYTFHAGGHYFFGKKETVSGHSFRYSGYYLVHTYAGAMYNHGKRTHFEILAGPALGIYNGTTRFNIGGTLSATYYVNAKLGVSPSFMLTKENGAYWLGAFSLRGSWAF